MYLTVLTDWLEVVRIIDEVVRYFFKGWLNNSWRWLEDLEVVRRFVGVVRKF